MSPIQSVLISLSTFTALSACSASYEVEHVTTAYTDKATRTGIHYTLPKTLIVAGYDIKYSKTMKGAWLKSCKEDGSGCESSKSKKNKYQFMADKCFEIGQAINNVDTPEQASNLEDQLNKLPDLTLADKPYTSQKHKILKTVLFTEAIPDQDHKYVLNVDFDLLNSAKHTFDLSETGIIQGIDTTVTNTAIEFAQNTLTSIKDFALALDKPDSSDFESKVVERDKSGGWRETEGGQKEKIELKELFDTKCKDVLTVVEEDKKRKVELENIELDKHTFLKERGYLAKPEALAKTLDSYMQQSKKINENFAKKYSVITEKKLSENLIRAYTEIIPDSGEKEASYNIIEESIELIKIAENQGSSRPEIKHAPNKEISDYLRKKLSLHLKIDGTKDSNNPWIHQASMCQTAPPDDECNKEGNARKSNGYRYRLPAFADVTLSYADDGSGQPPANNNKECTENINHKGISTSKLAIAQYGVLAILPSKISGREGSLDITLFGKTGAIDKITLNATGLDSKAASNFIDIGKDYVESKDKEELNFYKDAVDLLEAKQKYELLKAAEDEVDDENTEENMEESEE